MHTISELLDIAKKKNGLKSDRQLARALDLTAVHHYRTKGVIPDDFTAMKLAKLCGLPATEVLITCHLLKAAAGEKPEVHTMWKDVLKMVSNACIVLAALASLSLSPAPASAQDGFKVFTLDTYKISIMRHCLIAFIALHTIALFKGAM